MLSLFWIAAGILSLGPAREAGAELARAAGAGPSALFVVVAGGLVDILVGAAIAVRQTTRIGLYAALAIQPITGGLLAWQLGYSLHDGWIVISILLYLLTGAFWLPVVWMQIRMRNLAEMAAKSNDRLPPEYHRLFRWWFAFGFPAFGAVMLIFWLIIARPAIFSWASTESDL